jgi:hypothetical protein
LASAIRREKIGYDTYLVRKPRGKGVEFESLEIEIINLEEPKVTQPNPD